MSVWYETCIEQKGEIRDVIVRGNLEGAKRAIDQLKVDWPKFDMIFVRQHGKRKRGETSQDSFRVLQKLTIKPEVAA